MRSICIAIVTCFALGLFGCGPAVIHTKPASKLDEIERRAPSQGPVIDTARPLTITIESPTLGGVVIGEGKVNGKFLNRASLHELTGNADEETVKAEFSQLKEANKLVGAGVIVDEYAAVFADLLRQHLSTRLPRAVVKLGTGGDLQVKSEGTSSIIGMGKTFVVTLNVSAMPKGSVAPLTVQGEGSRDGVSAGVRYGLLPLGIITFPLGLAIIAASIAHAQSSLQTSAYTMAIDDAAKLALEIFRWAESPPEPPVPAAPPVPAVSPAPVASPVPAVSPAPVASPVPAASPAPPAVPSNAAVARCTKDIDCSGDEVCTAGACAAP